MKFTAVLLGSVVFCGPAFGQSIGANLAGVVTDETGARLQDATVTISHALNGRTAILTTGREGEYRAVALLPGEYDIAAARSGFSSVARRVALLVGADATLNLTLPLAGVVEQTTVNAATPLVEVARSQPSSVVTKQDIDTLPVLDRNFLVLAQLLPGSGPINSTVTRLATTKFGGVADQRAGYTTLIDGGDINDTVWGSPTINVSEEAMQEFKVFRNQFDAQYGHALNAVVTVATRSGTNRFGGTGFYFGRDDALNARYPFAAENPSFDKQRVGGSMGGPLIRDRTHFFASYERENADTVRVVALPPSNPFAARENGIFPAEADSHMASARLDHRFGEGHFFSARYASDSQKSLRANAGGSDSSQVDILNRSHSLVLEETWSATQSVAHAFRVHLLNHRLGTFPRDTGLAIRRPSVTTGVTNPDAWVVPVTRVTVSNALYLHTSRSDFKVGGEMTLGTHDQDSHVYENGFFEFETDAPFDSANPATWPSAYSQQKPVTVTYRSREFGVFAQDDWRLGNRIRLNAGLRYDIDLNLRLNDFYGRALDDPNFRGLDRFISRDRGTDTNNLQPRLGATWDSRGDGTLIVRGGWGVYVTRNRPWIQIRSMNQFASSAVRITTLTNRAQLQHFPDTVAVLGGRTLDEYLAVFGGRNLGTVIPDEFVQPYALNTTIGAGWQVNPTTTLDVDYIHSYANHQTGSTDVNLPPSGALSSANLRPIATFNQVTMVENFTKSWYDAVETQLRSRIASRGSLQVSYTLSRSYLDGVDFFTTMRGTQRTSHERGYNPSDQRHNLTVAGTLDLPWSIQVSGILKLISGSPTKVQAGGDLDGDSSQIGDLPDGIPITVGRERVDESLAAINAFRAARRLAPIDRSLLALDPYRTLDVRLMKSLPIGRDRRLELLIEGFNITNHVNFRPPFGNPPGAGVPMNAPAFLVRTNAHAARQIQWGVRYAF
jgi:Carboxypeptidase regulatory-like domain